MEMGELRSEEETKYHSVREETSEEEGLRQVVASTPLRKD